MLYLVPTPIGNLEDITLRAIRVLKEVDYILCEDTRTSAHLLHHFEIKTKLTSYHKFNEKKQLERVIQDLKNGMDIALISDAGTPLVSDPGFLLVKELIKEKIPFTALPGPSSLLPALSMSGFFETNFAFWGFIPKKEKERRSFLQKALFFPGVSIAFESPHRILATLKTVIGIDELREVCIAREISKKFEEILRGNPKELVHHFENKPPKGEMVLLFAQKELKTEDLSPIELIEMLKELHGYSVKEAVKIAAKLLNEDKRSLYKKIHKKDENA